MHIFYVELQRENYVYRICAVFHFLFVSVFPGYILPEMPLCRMLCRVHLDYYLAFSLPIQKCQFELTKVQKRALTKNKKIRNSCSGKMFSWKHHWGGLGNYCNCLFLALLDDTVLAKPVQSVIIYLYTSHPFNLNSQAEII